ncbi:hypothetical protein CBR_g34036 [Chara braunii]|uniref:Reverse transcriptase RNase H-like domain-containing protein n=1 Tax=Chara braunii TaxID=69332 RepID=A0A388LHY3_CHABU|nr:hypothetical protein CBR_g34036 [Chara braunii]|eukprot:GBG81853.1 hypothetical protein CBR_g34036 [Chara braunii]
MLHDANCKAAFRGTTSNLIIEIGKVRARTSFFVMPDVDHSILLGRSFLCRTESLILNKHNETMILLLCDPACGNYEVITCRNTGLRSGRNKPNLGSFTFEESKNELRRLWEVPEEEEGTEVLTLSFSDVNKAMEVVAAHDMADLEAIKALREQVFENRQVRSLLEEYNLTASGLKSKHCMREATIVGFVFNENGRRPDVKKTDKIMEWPIPFRSITDVRSFLDTCGFWRSFVENFTAKTEHLRKMVRQDQKWVWGGDQEEAVKRMKAKFKEGDLVLGAPNYEVTEEKLFIIETDVGPTALGGVLVQADAEGKERLLWFESRTLNTAERNYSQFKKETLMMLHCLRIFRNYVFGRRFILRVDPTALASSLKNYTQSDPTVARWLAYIWIFNFELNRIPGDKNRADWLSLINWDEIDQESIEDTPPIDRFLDQEEDVRLHINEWSLRVPSCVGHPIWLALKGYKQKEKLILKPFQKEDPWGGKDFHWMTKLASAGTHNLAEEVRTIEEVPTQPTRYEPAEESSGPEPEAEPHEPGELQTEEVITVGDDTPPPTPIPEQVRQYRPEGIPEPDSEEIPILPSETITPPLKQAEPEEQEEIERAGTRIVAALQPAEHAAEHMDTEMPASEGLPPKFPPPKEGGSAGVPLGEVREARVGRPSGETAEEKFVRVQACIAKIYEKKIRMEAAGEAPTPPIDPGTSEQRIGEPWTRYEDMRDAACLRSREAGRGDERVDEARETGDLGFFATRMAIERTDKRILQAATTYFQRYAMLSDELAASWLGVEQLSTQLAEEKAKNQAWRSQRRAREAEWERRLQDMAAVVERLSATKVVDWTEQSRYGIQGEEVRGLFGQGGMPGPPEQERMKKFFLDPAEVEARRKAEEKSFSFKAPTELASQQATPMMIENPMEGPTQRSQPPLEEGGPAEESPTILLEVQGGTLTEAVATAEPETMEEEASRLNELVAAMEVDIPLERPQRLNTPEYGPKGAGARGGILFLSMFYELDVENMSPSRMRGMMS